MWCGEMGVAIDDNFIKVTGYRPHRHAALCTYPAENVLWAAGEELLYSILFFSYNFNFSGEISIQSGQQRNLYRLLEGLKRAFCYISYSFQDTPFQACKTEILGVRPRRFSNFFQQPEWLLKKLSSVPRQCLCGEYTRKAGLTDAHNFKKLTAKIWTVYLLYLCTGVRYGRTDSCSADLFHRLLKDTALLVVAMPA